MYFIFQEPPVLLSVPLCLCVRVCVCFVCTLAFTWSPCMYLWACWRRMSFPRDFRCQQLGSVFLFIQLRLQRVTFSIACFQAALPVSLACHYLAATATVAGIVLLPLLLLPLLLLLLFELLLFSIFTTIFMCWNCWWALRLDVPQTLTERG